MSLKRNLYHFGAIALICFLSYISIKYIRDAPIILTHYQFFMWFGRCVTMYVLVGPIVAVAIDVALGRIRNIIGSIEIIPPLLIEALGGLGKLGGLGIQGSVLGACIAIALTEVYLTHWFMVWLHNSGSKRSSFINIKVRSFIDIKVKSPIAYAGSPRAYAGALTRIKGVIAWLYLALNVITYMIDWVKLPLATGPIILLKLAFLFFSAYYQRSLYTVLYDRDSFKSRLYPEFTRRLCISLLLNIIRLIHLVYY